MRSSVFLMVAVALPFVAVSCRDASSDQERADGLAIRAVMRANECGIDDINRKEFAYAENVRLFLQAARSVVSPTGKVPYSGHSDKWPTTTQVDDLITPLQRFVLARSAVKAAMEQIQLNTPLPIAIREDVRQALNERIAVDETWRVRLQALKDAIIIDDDVVLGDQIRRTDEAFQAYGSPQNILRAAADDIEEQLRLPWWNSPSVEPKNPTKENPCGNPVPPPPGG